MIPDFLKFLCVRRPPRRKQQGTTIPHPTPISSPAANATRSSQKRTYNSWDRSLPTHDEALQRQSLPRLPRETAGPKTKCLYLYRSQPKIILQGPQFRGVVATNPSRFWTRGANPSWLSSLKKVWDRGVDMLLDKWDRNPSQRPACATPSPTPGPRKFASCSAWVGFFLAHNTKLRALEVPLILINKRSLRHARLRRHPRGTSIDARGELNVGGSFHPFSCT